ncbi:MAG: Rieske 2Fe-2S domain-containing protein [Streptosporangiales bacterium]|nr:Rieske 2Fe-2S domain-containing protein [Streptosporangiales bacterium]
MKKKLYVVAEVDEIPPGGRKIVEIERRSIGVFNINGEYFALRNACPHAGGPLCRGLLTGFLRSSEPGQYTYLRRGEFLRCPWHQWEFDIRTGQSWLDPDKTRVRTYQTRVEPGQALLENEVELMGSGLTKGPYVAETYPVHIDGRYVVLEL